MCLELEESFFHRVCVQLKEDITKIIMSCVVLRHLFALLQYNQERECGPEPSVPLLQCVSGSCVRG